jgi:hypothetical protein
MDSVRHHCDRTNFIAYKVRIDPILSMKDKARAKRRLKALNKRIKVR